MATQLGYNVLWNMSIKEPRNTGFPDRMIGYFFSLSVKASILRCSGQKLSYFIFFRGVHSYTKLLHLIVDYARPLSKMVTLVRSFQLAGDCGSFCKN